MFIGPFEPDPMEKDSSPSGLYKGVMEDLKIFLKCIANRNFQIKMIHAFVIIIIKWRYI